jgi:hypothetical protein
MQGHTKLRPSLFEYMFGQNVTEHNPAASPSGGPPAASVPHFYLNDFTQIFTKLAPCTDKIR